MKNIIVSAFADEYSSDFDTQLKMLADNGIKYIEPRFLYGKNVADLTKEEANDAAKKLSAFGIGVSSIGSPLGKINLVDDFSEHLEKAKRVFEVSNILGTKNIRMFSFYLREGESPDECRGEVIEKLGKMIDLAEGFGVTLCHENEAKIYGESPERCFDILEEFKGKLKAVFDMGNFVLDGYRPHPDAYEMLKEHIEYFHIKDALYKGAIVPPGLGEASIEEILAAHSEKSSKNFFITLEPHLETFDGLNALVGKTFENPYKFANKEEAFLMAIEKLKMLINEKY